MIYIRLAGGLGNQIFMLGAGFLLAKKNNDKKIVCDVSYLGKYDTKRKNELLSFFDFQKLELEVEFRKVIITKYRIPRILPLKLPKYPFISDKNFQSVIKKTNMKFLLVDGYFQNCLNQADLNTEIEIFKNILIKKDVENINACVVHIRGGDFLKLGINDVAPKSYYYTAMQFMIQTHNIEEFNIVTDDKEYATTIVEDLKVKYNFVGGSMYEDFYLIGRFNYRILSSSTFSFWASALSNNERSVVVAPEFWIPNDRRNIKLPNEIKI